MLNAIRDDHTDEEIREIFNLKNIAVIGMSKSPYKAANYVPNYLRKHGYHIIPVNPNHKEIEGLKSYPRIDKVEEEVDIVEIFRPSEEVLERVEEAVKIKPKVIWLQMGIHNQAAEDLAREHGIMVVFNRCMYPEHQRLVEN